MKKKGLLAVLLALIVIVSQVPVNISADTVSGYEHIDQEDVEYIKEMLNSVSELCNDEKNIDKIGNMLLTIGDDIIPYLGALKTGAANYCLFDNRNIEWSEEYRYSLEVLEEIRNLFGEKLYEVSLSECKEALFYLYPYGYYTVWSLLGIEEQDPYKTDMFFISGETTDKGYHKLSWNKLWFADNVKYKVYGAQLGKKYRLLATVDENEKLSYTNKVTDDNIWKYYVVPYIYVGNNDLVVELPKSTPCFLVSNNKKYTNANDISIEGSKEITLYVGESKKLKVNISKEDEDKDFYSGKSIKKARYITFDDRVADVSKNGKITAYSEGYSYIYAVSENGLTDYIKVNVIADRTAAKHIEYSYATKDEGIDFLMSNTEYYNGFSKQDLEYRLKKKNGTLEEYLEYAKQQVMDFTADDMNFIDNAMIDIEDTLAYYNYTLPETEHITFIKTTMLEEDLYSAAYTHGTQIYLGMDTLEQCCYEGGYDQFIGVVAHELFHCLTRSNPEFRKDMYKIISFTVQDEEFVIPPSVMEHYCSNPDVEHHNSYATFNINGEDVDCFLAFICLSPFKNAGDSFIENKTTAVIPIDGTDTFYLPEEVSDFNDILGVNTDYVIDPEECLAENFKFALLYSLDSKFKSPEIIDAIRDYLRNNNR